MLNKEEIQMPGVIMPELVLYQAINSILSIIREDLNSRQAEDTILFHYFGLDRNKNEIEIETFNYFNQACELFKDSQSVAVNLGYNMSVTDKPCIHIMLPNESGKPLGIGADENYIGYVRQSNRDDVGQAIFTQMFDATYNLVITSENSLAVMLIYNLLKSSLLSLNAHLGLSGLLLPKISGQDIQLQSDQVPTHIFHRAIGISFTYELNVPDIMRTRLIRKFKVTGINCVNNRQS